MSVTSKKLTFEEYLDYNDGTNARYELVAGELVPMSLGTGQHGAIAKFLERLFDEEIAKLNRRWTAQRFAVGIQSPRGGRWETCRIPDVMVLSIDAWESLAQREAVIELNELPPFLVVEIVSESTRSTDYRSKRSEYAVLDIPEYWIVDPIERKVTICSLREGFYDEAIFGEEERITSPTFPELAAIVSQILAGGMTD
jgi:Uma2 family endonuclease